MDILEEMDDRELFKKYAKEGVLSFHGFMRAVGEIRVHVKDLKEQHKAEIKEAVRTEKDRIIGEIKGKQLEVQRLGSSTGNVPAYTASQYFRELIVDLTLCPQEEKKC